MGAISFEEANAGLSEPSRPRTISFEEANGSLAAGNPGSLTIPELEGTPNASPGDFLHRAFVKPAENLATGYRAGASGMYQTGANALMLLNRMADSATDRLGTGIPSTSPESGFGAAERWMRDTAKRVAPQPDDVPQDVMGKVYGGLGRAPADIAGYVMGSRLLGPVAGMAGVDALREADKGPEAAAIAGAKGALMGGTLKATESLTRPARAGAMAGVGGTQAAVEGGDIGDVVAGATVMGALGAASPGGNVRLRDIPRRITLDDANAALRPERIEPTLEPRSAAPMEPKAGESGGPEITREVLARAPIQPEPVGRTPADTEPPRQSVGPAIELGKKPISLDEANKTLSEMPEVSEMAPPGAQHVGFRQQTYDPAVEPTGKPIRREDVLGPLFKAFDVPLYEGRIRSDKTLGFFRRPVEEVRTKYANDMETAVHEAAHLLDSRVPEIKAQYKGSGAPHRDELLSVSYDRSKPHEGFAEFVRLWATQPAEAAARAPRFNGWFNDFVARSEYGPALTKFRQDAQAWFDQSALDRARSKIGVTEAVNEHLNKATDRFRQSVFDDLHGIMRMEYDLTGKLAPAGAYETARLTRGKTALTEGAMRYGAPKVNQDGSHSFTGKGLEQILKPVTKNLDDFLLYSVGRSARELLGQGREHLFSPAEIKAMTALERPEFKTAFAEYQGWNRAILDFAEAKGVINPHVRSQWMRADYLPFHRVDQGGQFQKVPGDFKGIKALTGGTENIRDVLSNVIGNGRMLIDAALTNEARLKVVDLAKGEGGAKFMAQIPAESRMVKVQAEEVRQAIMKALGMDMRDLSGEARTAMEHMIDSIRPVVELAVHNQAPVGRNVVAVLRQGKPEYYEVADPILFRALTSFNRPVQHWATQLLSIPKRIGQASITLAPDFIAANIARDTLMGGIMSRHGFRPIIDSAKGLKASITRDPTYREYIANGGGLSSQLLDETAFRKHLSRFYESKGIDARAVMNSPAKLLLGLERIAEAFETATRIGEYKRAIERGEHPRHAAYSAREVSTDFAMRGDSQALGFLYDTALFFKAGMNSMDRLYRGLAHDPNKGAIAAKAGLLALSSMGLYALNRGNPLYDQLEDWDKDAHWHFFVPRPDALRAQAEGKEVPLKDRYAHLMYPKIWEVGALSSLAERSLKATLDGMNKADAAAMGKTVLRSFNLNPMPHAATPIIAGYANYDSFRDRPIEPESIQDLAPWARATAGTSTTMRKLGEAQRNLPRGMQMSPAHMEALLKGYFNTWALYGLSMIDAAAYDSVPDLRTDQLPVVRRFYRQEPARTTRYERELYDALKEATEARRTMSWLDKHWRPDLAGELENTQANRLYGQSTKVAEQLRIFRRESEEVLTAETLPQVQKLTERRAKDTKQPGFLGHSRMSKDWGDVGALKRRLLDSLTEERNTFAKEAYDALRESKRESRP